MKPNKVFLIIGTVFLTFGLLLGGVYFYVSKTLTPEKVRTVIVDLLQTEFPTAKVNVGSVNFNFSTSIEFVINTISVEKDGPLFTLEDAKVKIPLWAILKGGGVVEFDVVGPSFSWRQIKESNNWKNAMKATGPETSPKSEDTQILEVLPAFLLTSRLNIKLRDTKVFYEFNKNEKGSLIINKLLVKELGFENPAAFEIDTRLEVENEALGNSSAQILIIGETGLGRLISEKKLSILAVATVTKIKTPKLMNLAIPDLRADIKADITNNSDVNGGIKLTFKNSMASANFSQDSSGHKLSNIIVNLLAQDALEISGQALPDLAIGKAQVSILGDLSYEQNTFNQNISWQLSPAVNYTLSPGIVASVTSTGKIEGNKLAVKVEAQTLQGKISTSLATEINDFKFKELPIIDLDIMANDLVFEKNQLDSISNRKKSNESSAASKPFILPMNLNLKANNIKILDSIVNGTGDLTVGRKFDVASNLNLKVGSGTVAVTMKAAALPVVTGLVNVKMDDFPGNVVNPFLPKSLGSIDGLIDAKKTVKFKYVDELLTYQASFDSSIRNCKITKIDTAAIIQSVLGDLTKISPKFAEPISKIKIEPDFSLLRFNGTANEKTIKFKKIHVKAIEDKFEINGSGNLAQIPSLNSELILEYKDSGGNISEFLQKEVGTSILPLRLHGPGFELAADKDYTLKKIGNLYIKNKGKDQLKKAADKLLKNNKSINKLLKGILE